MRPVSVTLEGFSAYRRSQTLNLEDVEFFSLSGPTGSGKSSLVDAMIFALYGRVPRLGARAVAPVISAGADRARVAFQFEVRGQRYVVSRVAERTESGASVREARLESDDGSALANGAGEVTREVENLLRLRFDDFTKTVVLPQGEFARFLNAGSRERRDLLRDLLGLEIYTKLRELATERRSQASGEATAARSQLESLDVPDDGAMTEARDRLVTLEKLSEEIGARVEELSAIEAGLAKTVEEVEGLEEATTRLDAIAPPAHLEELDERLVAARETESLVREALAAKQEECARLEAEAAEMPGEDTISGLRETWQQSSVVAERLAGLDLDAARTAVDDVTATLTAANSELSAARSAAEAARVNHAAHTVRASLAPGEPCPVCSQDVSAVPVLSPPPELEDLDRAVRAAEETVERCRTAQASQQAQLADVEARASELDAQRVSLAERLADAPSLEELTEIEAARAESKKAIKRARAELTDLEKALKKAERDHEDADQAIADVDRVLGLARDTVSDLKPVYPDGGDAMVRWKELLAWRDTKREELVEMKSTKLSHLEEERTRLTGLEKALVADLEKSGVPVQTPYDVAVVRELEQARNVVARMEETLERAADLGDRLQKAEHVEAVAGALANHLRANGFERWLMAGAITGLVSGANEILDRLSSGGYSLESDDEGSFRIIDHRNANEIREVATLSGGETFLVSLALSLSLAETLSASGGTGLDAIILDEGFGSLDEESLDLVAEVLEDLAGAGLMVGVITHVKELAARAEVRFRVAKEPGGSKVERVE